MRAGSTITLCFTLIFFSVLITTSTAVDTLTANQTIRDGGNSTITSAGGVFELGFFSPRISKNRYLGIWYKIISTGTVVWVANRDTPLTNSSGVLRLDGRGTLVLVDGSDSIIWSSSNSSTPLMNNPVVAQLLDNGNLVMRYGNERDPENHLWQSFDHPGDHLLPGMKFGWDFVKGLDRHITSWKSDDDPSPGNYSFRVSLEGYPQMLAMGVNSVVDFRIGPWDGIKFSGTNFFKPNPIYEVRFVINQNEISYWYELSNSSSFMRIVLDPYGNLPVVMWINQTQSWESYRSSQSDDCDVYALCGAYSSCYLTKSQLGYVTCGCLDGFQPKFSANWNLADWSGGCVRQTPLDCENGDIFVKYSGLKLPDTRQSWFNQSMDLEDCKMECLNNCSCTAYTTGTDIREGGMGCFLWFGDLIDIRDYGENGLNLYIRMAVPKLEANRRSSRREKVVKICIIVIVAVVVPTILLGLFLIHVSKKKKLTKEIVEQNPENDARNGNEREDLELPLFDFQLIVNATDNFSDNKKLGEGGFGPVYKGILEDGQEIAVKRLSKSSQQGLDEFKNEVSCIAKLQH